MAPFHKKKKKVFQKEIVALGNEVINRLTRSQDEVPGKKREAEEESLHSPTIKDSFFCTKGETTEYFNHNKMRRA